MKESPIIFNEAEIESKKSVKIKVYMVWRRSNLASNNYNDELLCAKLSLTTAQRVVDETPGAYIMKVIADKD
jgi:hypothetical protein